MAEGFVFTDDCAGMTDSLKRLWHTVFKDDREYISLFFDKRLLPGQCVAASDGKEAAAMAFLLPFTLVAQSGSFPGKYIYAVATHPQYRRRGLSTALLEYADAKAKREGAALSALVPSGSGLFDFYAKRGFKTEFFKRETELWPDRAADVAELTPVPLQDMLSLRRRVFADSRAFVDWDERALVHQERENRLLGGETLSFSEPQKGYALCLPARDGVFIREWAAKELYPGVIAAIARRYQRDRVRIRLAACPDESGALPFAMTKWYNSERIAPSGAPAFISLVLD